jgi:nicotinamidase-related amidase
MKKLLMLSYLLLFLNFSSFANYNSDSIKTALLIIDIQKFYFPGDGPGLVNAEQAGLNAGEILNTFRNKKQLVIHIRHESKKGFEFYKTVEPLSEEKVFTKNEVNAFIGTYLFEFLKTNNINQLVIIGMQTHMCLEAAVRAAHDFGFKCIVIEDACATRDLKYGEITIKAEEVHASTLITLSGAGYGTVINMKEFIANPDKYIF